MRVRVLLGRVDVLAWSMGGFIAQQLARHHLASLAIPSLVITGRRDVITPPVNSRFLARRLPDAELTLVPGCGHSFLFQPPRMVSQRVLAFLDRA